MIEYLESIDRSLFLFLNKLGHPWLDGVMWYISGISTWIPVYLLFIWWIWERKGGKTVIASLIFIALVITLTDQISVKLFKEVFERYRPTHNLEIGDSVLTVINPSGNEYRGGLYSFVSSHAANNFGVAALIFFILRPVWWVWGTLLFAWAGIISYSRIYLGVHYPSDIFVGAILGIALGYFVYQIYRLVHSKLKWESP